MNASLETGQSPEVATADTAGFTDLYDQYYRDVYRYVAGRLGPYVAALTLREYRHDRGQPRPRTTGPSAARGMEAEAAPQPI